MMVLSMYKYCVRCTQCSGRAYPSKEQPTEPNLLRVVCTSCGTPRHGTCTINRRLRKRYLVKQEGERRKRL